MADKEKRRNCHPDYQIGKTEKNEPNEHFEPNVKKRRICVASIFKIVGHTVFCEACVAHYLFHEVF